MQWYFPRNLPGQMKNQEMPEGKILYPHLFKIVRAADPQGVIQPNLGPTSKYDD